ncbi:MAG TPA: stage II sporulation protein M [Cyclobacteriaceae bacterium]|jgi:uncharacterized membrane protein SpoIIM required for sporulation|nr:stage II sporulation protein M [Cyclobacteriaceae bacterium]
MRETRFISQNKQKWQEAETLLDNPVKDPEKLSNLFVQVVDDLSYSKTYYPNRSVRVYLNKIARQYFSIIYSQKKEKQNQFKLFWREELPQLILYSKRELLISLIVFLISMTIGIFSSIKDPQFVSTILGSSYVAMTEKNIANGDPMAVYKQSHQVDMFLGITFNNLMVAFRTYVLGIFLCIGTLASLLFNGVMVGSFQYFFLERGLLIESSLSIWLHGTLEISSIILAGGAGLTLGRGLIFPGTYSRLQSLQISGVRSLKLMLGIAPIFVLAAIIESFLTRYTDAPAFLKIALILLSAAFIIGYFVIYPWQKSKSGFEVPLKETRLPPTNIEPINFTRIKNNADVLKDTFQFYSRNSKSILPLVFLVAVGVSFFFLLYEHPQFIVTEEWWTDFFSQMFFALYTPTWPFVFINSLGMTIILQRVMKLIDKESGDGSSGKNVKSFWQIFIVTAIIYSAMYFGLFGALFVTCAFGILILTAFIQLKEKTSLTSGFAQAWELYGKNSNQGLGLQVIVLLLSFSFLLILYAPLHYIHISAIQWSFATNEVWSQNAIRFLELLIKVFSFYLIVPLVAGSLAYLYFSQLEVITATYLKESITKVGSRISRNNK